MKVTVHIPDDVPYWYKPVIWFIDPKDSHWTMSDLLVSICNELNLDISKYSLSGVMEDGGVISVIGND